MHMMSPQSRKLQGNILTFSLKKRVAVKSLQATTRWDLGGSCHFLASMSHVDANIRWFWVGYVQ